MDIVLPNNNEEEFIRLAEKLRINELVFAYSDSSKIKKLGNHKTAMIIDAKNADKCKGKTDFIIIKSSDNDKFVLEKIKPDFMYYFEFLSERDFMHQRASGLNEVLCRIAKKNQVKIFFPFSEFLELSYEKRSLVLGRLMQNMRLCKKFGVGLSIFSFAKTLYQLRNPNDLESFKKVL